MRLSLMAVVLWALAACSPSREDPDFAHGRPELLAGTWRLQLHGVHGTTAVGSLQLDSLTAVDPRAPQFRFVAGTFTIDSLGPFTKGPVAQTAQALLAPDSQAFVHLFYGGRCGDCGDVTLVGRLHGEAIEGHWNQEFLSDSPTGSFSMYRVP